MKAPDNFVACSYFQNDTQRKAVKMYDMCIWCKPRLRVRTPYGVGIIRLQGLPFRGEWGWKHRTARATLVFESHLLLFFLNESFQKVFISPFYIHD